MGYRGGLAAGVLCAAVALGGVAGCSSTSTPAAPPSSAAAAPSAGAGAGATPSAGASAGDQQTQLTQGYQHALALTQFGQLGGAQGVGEQVKSLGPELEQQGKDLEGRIKALAEAQQVSLDDKLAGGDETTLTQLRSQTGPPFDTAWLGAAQQLEQQARDWANGVLGDPNASPDAQGGARDLIAKLDALAPKLSAATSSGGTGSAGAGGGGNGAGGNSASGPDNGSGSGNGSGGSGSGNAPRSVNSGTGGQAATDDGIALPGALLALGIVLLGAAGLGLRRSSRS